MSLKIVFMGTPEFSVESLKALNNSRHQIYQFLPNLLKKKRGQKILPSPVQLTAERLKIPVRTPKDLNSPEEYNYLKKLKPDVIVVVAYGKRIPKKIFETS